MTRRLAKHPAWLLVLSTHLLLCAFARASEESLEFSNDTAAPAFVTASVGPDDLMQNARFMYEFWLRGMNSRALSGNTNGEGTNLSVLHTFAFGYQLNQKWSLGFTQAFSQSIDQKPATEKDPWVAENPYFAVVNNSLWKSGDETMNLYAYARYYFPFSRENARAVSQAKRLEAGRGSFRLYVNPTKSFLDGKLTLNLQTLVQIPFARRSGADRAAANGGDPSHEDFHFLFDPILTYTLNSNVEVYLEYATGSLHHYTNGQLSKLTDPDDGQYISEGMNILVGKKLLINPYFSQGPVFRGLKNTDIGILADYTFL
jgi:hypothetical protein